MRRGRDRHDALEPEGVCTSAWHAFMKMHRCEASMAEIAETWAGMTPDRKRAIWIAEQQKQQERDRVAAQEEARAANRNSPLPWPYVGDSSFPLRAELMEHVPQNAKTLDAAWIADIGEDVIHPRVHITESACRLATFCSIGLIH